MTTCLNLARRTCLALQLTRSVAEHVLTPVAQSLTRSVVHVLSRCGGAQYHREEHDEEQEGQRDAKDELDTPGQGYNCRVRARARLRGLGYG